MSLQHRRRSSLCTGLQAVLCLVLCAILCSSSLAEAVITYTTGSVVNPSLYQAVTLTIRANPLTEDPYITTSDRLYLVEDNADTRDAYCNTSFDSTDSIFSISAIVSGGYSGTTQVPITPDLVEEGLTYVVCFLSNSAGTASLARRGYVSSTSSDSAMLIWPAVYSSFTSTPAAPTAGGGLVTISIAEDVVDNRVSNQALGATYTVLMVACPSDSCSTLNAAEVTACATAGGSYTTDTSAVVGVEITSNTNGAVTGTFTVPYSVSSSGGYLICVPYCTTTSCSDTTATFTLVAATSPAIVIQDAEPSVYARTPTSPQAREDGIITFTGTALESGDDVKILASGSSSCSSSSASLLTNVELGNLTVTDSTTATISFLAPALLTSGVTGLVCYYSAATALWSPVYLDPTTSTTADFTIDVLQPSSFSISPSTPTLGTTVIVTFAGTGLDSTADAALLTTSTQDDNSACTSTDATTFTCTLTTATASSAPVCTVLVDMDENDAVVLQACYKKAGISNYALVSGTISIGERSPTYTISSSPLYAGLTATMTFNGDDLATTDIVKLVTPGEACSSATAITTVGITATSTVGTYNLVGAASQCIQVCYYKQSSSQWIISGPQETDRERSTVCDAHHLYIAAFPYQYSIRADNTTTNGGTGLTIQETTTVTLALNETIVSELSLVMPSAVTGLLPVSAKVVQTSDSCVTAFCGGYAACSLAQSASDYVSSISASTLTATLMVGTRSVNYVLCVSLSGATSVFLPVLVNAAQDYSRFGFSAAAANPSLSSMTPSTWRAWLSAYLVEFSGTGLSVSSDALFILGSSAMISTSDSIAVCPLPTSTPTNTLSSTLSTTDDSTTAMTATVSSGYDLSEGDVLYFCYRWYGEGTQARLTSVSLATILAPAPSSYVWGDLPSSGYYRAGNPFSVAFTSNTTTLSSSLDTVYFYRFSYSVTASTCYCSASSCASGTLINYLTSNAVENTLTTVSTTSVLYTSTSGFDNYGFGAYYVMCYTRSGESGYSTYLGLSRVGMADPTYYTVTLVDGASVARVGALITVTARSRCTVTGCPTLTTSDSLLLVASTSSCSDVEDSTTVSDEVLLIGSPVVTAGLTFSQTMVPLQEGSYRVCFKSADDTTSDRYSELPYGTSFVRQNVSVSEANPSAVATVPTSPTAGQFLVLTLTCSSSRCTSCQSLHILSGANANCWEDATAVATSTSCLTTTYSYQFPNVFLSEGSYTLCFGDTLSTSRRVPTTLTIGAANPSSFAPITGDGNSIFTNQIEDYTINITGTSLSAVSDSVFLLTEKGYTCHDLRTGTIQSDSTLSVWFAPSVNPYARSTITSGVQWLVSNEGKRFGPGMLMSTTVCPGDNEDCEMQLCYRRSSGTWAPVPLASSEEVAAVYVAASDPSSVTFDTYPLVVGIYTMVTVTGTNLNSGDSMAIRSGDCSGALLSVIIAGITPVVTTVEDDEMTWVSYIRVNGTASSYAVCYTRASSTSVVEIVMTTLTSSSSGTTSNSIVILDSPLYYHLSSSTFSSDDYTVTLYEELQVQATYLAAATTIVSLSSVQMVSGECNYAPFFTATGSADLLSVVDVLTVSPTDATTYQSRLYLNPSELSGYALCMVTSGSYYYVTQAAGASTTATSIDFGAASPQSYTYTPSHPMIGQSVALNFTASGATSGALAAGDTVVLLDGTLFDCGMDNATAIATGTTTLRTEDTTSTTVSLDIPYDTELEGVLLTVCYRKQNGSAATVPLGTALDQNFQVYARTPVSWAIDPLMAIVEQPLDITFTPSTSTTAPDLSVNDVAFLVAVPSTTASVTATVGNELCRDGTRVLESSAELTLSATTGATTWAITAMPAEATTYVVCYQIADESQAVVYVGSPVALTTYASPSPTGTYTNTTVSNTVFSGQRFHLFFTTAVELSLALEGDVTDDGTVDLVRLSTSVTCTESTVDVQTIPASFGYAAITEYNSDGILVPYLHLRLRATTAGTQYYVCLKRANQQSTQPYYNYRVVGGVNSPAVLTVTASPITTFVTSPTEPRAWVPQVGLTPTYSDASINVADGYYAQLFYVPFAGSSAVIGTDDELQYDNCYRPETLEQATSSTVTLVDTTLQVSMEDLASELPFPSSGLYSLCYQLSSSQYPTETSFIASVLPTTLTVLVASPIAYSVNSLITVERQFTMGFVTIDNIFATGLSNTAQIYVSATRAPVNTEAPSCTDATVPTDDSVAKFTSFTSVNSTYATVLPTINTEDYYYVCFLSTGQDQMFPVPNYDGGGYYFSVGLYGPQTYTVVPDSPLLGSIATLTIAGSLLSSNDRVKVVFVDSSTTVSASLCTSTAVNADVDATSADGVSVSPEAGGLSAIYAPRLNATGTHILCYQSSALGTSWLYVSPVVSFTVLAAHPTSYLLDPTPGYATAQNTLVIRDNAGYLTTSSDSLKLVTRGSGGALGFDCLESATQSSLVGLVKYLSEGSSATYASYQICTTAAVELTVCYQAAGMTGWAEVPFSSPPPSYLFEALGITASPFSTAPSLSPTVPRPYETFTLTLASDDASISAYNLAFASAPQALCADEITYVTPLYLAERATNSFNVSLPHTGSYVVYVTMDADGPAVTLADTITVGSCDPCSFTPSHGVVTEDVVLSFPSATGSSLSITDQIRIFPVSQGLSEQPCEAVTGPYEGVTFTAVSVGVGGSSSTFVVTTGSEETIDDFLGSYYVCYQRATDESFAVVASSAGVAKIFSLLPSSEGVVASVWCPLSGSLYASETVTINITAANSTVYPALDFSTLDELVLLLPAAVPTAGCNGVTSSAEILAAYPSSVMIPTLESYSTTSSNWYGTLLSDGPTTYLACFRLAYTSTFYSLTDTLVSVLAADPSTMNVYPPLVLPTDTSFSIVITGTSLSSSDTVILVDASVSDCMESCYYSETPSAYTGLTISQAAVTSQEATITVTPDLDAETSVVIRVCYRRVDSFLTDLGTFLIGEQNPVEYNVSFVPRVGTRPTIGFNGTALTSTDTMFLVVEGQYCVERSAVAVGTFVGVSADATSTTFTVPLTVSTGAYTVCYVVSTVGAGVSVGDALEVLSGGPSAFAVSNLPMVGRATNLTFPTTTASTYQQQVGDAAYVACNGCSCYDEVAADVAYGDVTGTLTSDDTTELTLRFGFSSLLTYNVCYKVVDSGYALVSTLTLHTASPAAVSVVPTSPYQGQRLAYTFATYTTNDPASVTDEVMLVSSQRLCWNTPSLDETNIILNSSALSSLTSDDDANVEGVWSAHIPSVGPDALGSSSFPLSYLLCYQEAGQDEYLAVPYPISTSTMPYANPSTFTTVPTTVSAGMMGVRVTFPDAVEGDVAYVVAYNPESNTVCTDASTTILSVAGTAYPYYLMNLTGSAPVSDTAAVFCFTRTGATVAEVPTLLPITAGNPSGYVTNITDVSINARFRQYIELTISGVGLVGSDLIVFSQSTCANTVGDETSSSLLYRISDTAVAESGESVVVVAQFMPTTTVTGEDPVSMYVCYVRDSDVWTEVGAPLVLRTPAPTVADLYHASLGSVLDAPLRVGQHLQIQLTSPPADEDLLQAAVLVGDDTSDESWCSNFTAAGVLEPSIAIESTVLLNVPIWSSEGASRLCLLNAELPWADAGMSLTAPYLATVLPPNPTLFTVYPSTPRVGQQVTLTFTLIVESSSEDAVKIIEYIGDDTPSCEDGESLVGFASDLYVTVESSTSTSLTLVDTTDDLLYRSFNSSVVARVCYFSAVEQMWGVVPPNLLTVLRRAPTSWSLYSGTLVAGQLFQLKFEDADGLLNPSSDRVWAVPDGTNCTTEVCDGCLSFTINATESTTSSVITVSMGTVIVNSFNLCYALENATAAYIPDQLIIPAGDIHCSETTEVVIGQRQSVVFEKESGVDVTDDSWRVSFYAVDEAVGCEGNYMDDFVAGRATIATTTDTTVTYTLEWPVMLTDSRYIVCYTHDNVVGPVCTCEQIAAKDGSCYLATTPGSPASFLASPYPTYVGEAITLTFTLDEDLVDYPPTAVKLVTDTDPLLTTCEEDAAFTPTDPVLTKVSDTSYTYVFQHDYTLGSDTLIVCVLTSRSTSYARVGSATQNNVLTIRPFMALSTFPSASTYIRVMETLTLNFTHSSREADDVVSMTDEIFFVTDPYSCTATYIDAQDPAVVVEVIDLYDTAFDTVPADVSSINTTTKSSFTMMTYTTAGTYYMCYKLAEGTWAPVLPALTLLSSAITTCTATLTPSPTNTDLESFRAMQYIPVVFSGGDTLSSLVGTGTIEARVMARNQLCAASGTGVFQNSVVATTTTGEYTTTAFSPSSGTYKVCYRFVVSGTPVTNWSPTCDPLELTAPSPTGDSTGCFLQRQAVDVLVTQADNYVYTTTDTFRVVSSNVNCLTSALTAGSVLATVTLGDTTQTSSGVSPTVTGGTTYSLPYALLLSGTTGMRLCYTDAVGNQFAVPLQYSTLPTASSTAVEASQPSQFTSQEVLTVGQQFYLNYTSRTGSSIALTRYAALPSPFAYAPEFDGTFDGSALLATTTGTVYRDGRCIAAMKASDETNPLGLLGVYGPTTAAYTITAFAPTTAQSYITCYRLANCLVADIGQTIAVQGTNPDGVTNSPSIPRRGQLITVTFARNTEDATSVALTPGSDRATKQVDLASCWTLSNTAGSLVAGTTELTYFTAFFAAQSPSTAANSTTRSCYRLAKGSWSSVPNGEGTVIPANPTHFETSPSIPRVFERIDLLLYGSSFTDSDVIKIVSGALPNCSESRTSSPAVTAYDSDGAVLSAQSTAGEWVMPNVTSDGTSASIPLSFNETGTYSVCYRLITDTVWTLVYSNLVVSERNPSTVVMSPVAVLESELFTLTFAAADDGSLASTDRVVLYAGEDVSCLAPGDAVSLQAAPSNTDNLPSSLSFQMDCPTRGTYTMCYFITSATSDSEVTRAPVWGFDSIVAQADPLTVDVYPQKDGSVGALRYKELVSLVFGGFGLVADDTLTDEVKILTSATAPTDAVCRESEMTNEVALLPLYANGTYAVQVLYQNTTVPTNEPYWICYKLSGGQFHAIGDSFTIDQAASPATATNGKSDTGDAGTFTYYDGEAISWTLTTNTGCDVASSNYLFYSASQCADVWYYEGSIDTDSAAAKAFPYGYTSVNCDDSSSLVRIADRSVLGISTTALTLCYYYGSPSATTTMTLPSVTLLGEPNALPVSLMDPPALSEPLAVMPLTAFSFTLGVVPTSFDYLVLVRDTDECYGTTAPEDASLFLHIVTNTADITVTAAVPSGGLYYICSYHPVGSCATTDRECARVVGTIIASAANPSGWQGAPSSVYTTDSYNISLLFNTASVALEQSSGAMWMVPLSTTNATAWEAYSACVASVDTTNSYMTMTYSSDDSLWVSNSRFSEDTLHALCYNDSTSQLFFFGAGSKAGPLVLRSVVTSGSWVDSVPAVNTESVILLEGGGLTSSDTLVAVRYTTDSVPSDVCTSDEYTSVSAVAISTVREGLTTILRTFVFLKDGKYVLCFRSAAWDADEDAELVSSIGTFSVIPGDMAVTVAGERQYVNLPLTLLFTGSSLSTEDSAAIVYVGDTETVTVEVCETATITWGNLDSVTEDGLSGTFVTTPDTVGLYAVCFKTSTDQVLLMSNRVEIFEITAVSAQFATQPTCEVTQICRVQPAITLLNSSALPAVTPGATIALWLVNEGETTEVDAGLTGATTYLFTDYTTFQFFSVSVYSEGTYQMKANITLPDSSLLQATSSAFSVSNSSNTKYVASLSCTPSNIVESVEDTVDCIVTTLITPYPSSYTVSVQAGSTTECTSMDADETTGLPRCGFTVTPPQTSVPNYILITVVPSGSFALWPVMNAPAYIRLPHDPVASSVLLCSAPTYTTALPSDAMVRYGDALSCAVQGMAMVNGVLVSAVVLPEKFNIQSYVNSASSSATSIDIGTYPEGVNGLYSFGVSVNDNSARSQTVTGLVLPESNTWVAMSGSPQEFVVLGSPTKAASTLSCSSSVSGSATWFSVSNGMTCKLQLANGDGSVLGLMQDFTITMPSGGVVGTLPTSSEASDSLSFTLTAPAQPVTSTTSEFTVNALFVPTSTDLADLSLQLVYVSDVVSTSSFPQRKRVTMVFEGTGLVVTHAYRVSGASQDCGTAGSLATATLGADSKMSLSFVVPAVSSFIICYCPSDATVYQLLLQQSFFTSEGSSSSEWTKANVALLAVGVALFSILLVLLIILLWRVFCVKRREEEDPAAPVPSGYVPPRSNDRYVQASVNPVAPPSAPVVTHHHVTQEADITRVRINLHDDTPVTTQVVQQHQQGSVSTYSSSTTHKKRKHRSVRSVSGHTDPAVSTPPPPIPVVAAPTNETLESHRGRHRRRHSKSGDGSRASELSSLLPPVPPPLKSSKVSTPPPQPIVVAPPTNEGLESHRSGHRRRHSKSRDGSRASELSSLLPPVVPSLKPKQSTSTAAPPLPLPGAPPNGSLDSNRIRHRRRHSKSGESSLVSEPNPLWSPKEAAVPPLPTANPAPQAAAVMIPPANPTPLPAAPVPPPESVAPPTPVIPGDSNLVEASNVPAMSGLQGASTEAAPTDLTPSAVPGVGHTARPMVRSRSASLASKPPSSK